MDKHCADAISRQAAIDALISFFGLSVEEEYGSAVNEVINALPSVQPEYKMGHWIIFEGASDQYDDIKCSECNTAFTVDTKHFCDIGFTVRDFKFCPNCGADMRGEANG